MHSIPFGSMVRPPETSGGFKGAGQLIAWAHAVYVQEVDKMV